MNNKRRVFGKCIAIIICIALFSTSYTTATTVLNQESDESIVNEEIELPFFIDDWENSTLNSIQFVPGEIIVKFKDQVDIEISANENGIAQIGVSSVDELNKQNQVTSVQKICKNSKETYDPLGFSNVFKFVLPLESDVLSLVREYEEDQNVVYAEPNYIYQTCNIPNDPFYTSYGSWGQYYQDLYNMHIIDAAKAWNITTGGEDVIIAVVDTGVDYTHPDLSANMWTDGSGHYGYDFVTCNEFDPYGECIDPKTEDDDPMDDSGHGTHCAGIIGAVGNNSLGVVGVNWRTKIMAVKSINRQGGGYTDWLANGIIWAVDHGAHIISISWGGKSDSQLIHNAINYAYSQGVVLVAAAGNYDSDKNFYPAAYENVIAVAATDHNDAWVTQQAEWIDVAAPGVGILSTFPLSVPIYDRGIVTVNSDSNNTLQAIILEYSIMPPAEGLYGQLLYVECGRYASDFEGQNFTGKIVLVKETSFDYFYFVVQNAYDAGAIGAIIYVDGYNLFWGTLYITSAIPTVSVSEGNGEYLRQLIEDGPTYVTISAADLGDNLVMSGTSMACPHVAGLAGLLLSKNHSLTPDMVRTIIAYTADEIESSVYVGKGRINASAALQQTPVAIKLISFPSPYIVEGAIDINGTAWGESFDYYVIEYGRGNDPSIWTDLANSTTPVQDGVLSVLDTTILNEGFYTIRLRMVCADDMYEETISIVVNNEYNLFVVDDDDGPGVDYNSIRDAIEDTGHGDSIYVRNGVYYEHIIIDRSIELLGEDKNNTIIDYSGRTDIVRITANNVNITDFTLRNSTNYFYDWDEGYYGALTILSGYNIIAGNIFKHNRFGIILKSPSHNNIIKENTFTNSETYGIYMTWSYTNNISQNTMTRGGIYADCSHSNMISKNTITDDAYSGIGLYGGFGRSYNNIISGNIIENNGIYGIRLLGFEGKVEDNIISGNTIINHKTGISISSLCFDNRIHHNNLIDNNQNAYDKGNSNTWYDTTLIEGNFWDDFDEPCEGAFDNDSNGIIDSPYEIPGKTIPEQDLYPLSLPLFGTLYVNANGPYHELTDTPIQFDGYVVGSYPPFSYSWDFGDGNTSNELEPIHSYSVAGTYAVTLTVTDDSGNSSSHTTSATAHEPTVYNVDKDLWYWKIQAAIDEADAGNTITVMNGIYRENLLINETLTILGNDKTQTIIDAGGSGSVVQITASYVTIKGFTLRNSRFDPVQEEPFLPAAIACSSTYATIMNNIITNNDLGIYCLASSYNTITKNTIRDNEMGVRLQYLNIGECFYSHNNLFYHNNFINNSQQARNTGNNFWDNGTEGNYWDDYSGNDADGDGIGDVPYVISGTNQDNYPFMNPNGWNNPPEIPATPSGKKRAFTNVIRTYSSNSTDPDGDEIFYLWDWGDGNFSDWLGPYDSGVTAEASHTWTKKGSYQTRVKAKDTCGAESDWSEPFTVFVWKIMILPYESIYP